MNVVINGERKELDTGIRIVELLSTLGLKAERLAVEVNRRIVRRADWESTVLFEGDKIEIVHFVGGGASSRRF